MTRERPLWGILVTLFVLSPLAWLGVLAIWRAL